MRRLRTAANSLFFALVAFSVPLAFAQNEGTAKKKSASADPCSSKMTTERFVVDFTGSVSNTGRTYEGPLCVEVSYNPIQQFVGLHTVTTTEAGPDLSKVALGGPTAGGVLEVRPGARPANLPAAMAQLVSDAKALTDSLNLMRQNYSSVMQSQEDAIGKIALLRQTTTLVAGSDAIGRVKSGYKELKESLNTALKATAKFSPSDRADNSRRVLLFEAQALEDRLNTLPLDFASGTQKTFDCTSSADHVGWSDWLAQCRDSVYTPLKSILDVNLQTAKDFASDSEKTTVLKKKIAVVQYWDFLFSTLGLTTGISDPDLTALDMTDKFFIRTAIRCGILFNQTANTAVNIVAADLTPTLQGDPPTIRAQGAFVTVSCGTPFAVSAGVGFHTIRQKQFAILQSPDGQGGTVNTFGLTSDSNITPVALALVHVRLAEWNRHKFAFYGSLGVGGSVQNQSNASPVQFLPGVSISFWRTMFITLGPDIGNKTSLAGGFKLGDVVPPGVSSVPTETSHAVGFGFAISFTKP